MNSTLPWFGPVRALTSAWSSRSRAAAPSTTEPWSVSASRSGISCGAGSRTVGTIRGRRRSSSAARSRPFGRSRIPGGDLEEVYDRLKGELERCEARADEVRDDIRSIDEVAADLFEEWENEAQQYSSSDLRRKAERMLRDTQGVTKS